MSRSVVISSKWESVNVLVASLSRYVAEITCEEETIKSPLSHKAAQ